MDSSQYVEAGTYHWTELQENLTMYYEAYTFFRPTGEGDYRVVVDSAYGIHIDGWTVTPDGRYSDLATIRISYTVLGPGTAAISGNIGEPGGGAGVLYFKKERDE